MIHEIILSLIGQTGDIIILVDKRRNKTKKDNNLNIDEYCFEVNNNIHIFLSSEIKIINEIVQLGYCFYIINIFCLLVKKNTIYKNLTHIHKFNKLNEERKGRKRKDYANEKIQRDEDIPRNASSSFTSSSSTNSSSTSSSSISSSCESSSSGNESEEINNLNNSFQKRKYEKKNEIDNYFGVVLRNIKSLDNVSPYGYYANGISNEINKFMRRYLKKISEIEEYINNNSNTPLTQILTMLEKKREEIIIIINIIKNYLEFQKKEEQNVLQGESRNKTKEILDYLYENCLNGNSRIKSIYHRYFKNLGKILLHQTFSWMLYGQLLDPYYEFFIQKRQFIYSDDKKIFLSPEELYENLTLTNVQSLNFEWNYLFFQSVSNLPDCCIDKVAGRKILFIGKSIRILIRSNKWSTSDITKLFSITKILSKAFDEAPTNGGYKKIASFQRGYNTMNNENGVGSENGLYHASSLNATKGGVPTNTNDYLRSLNISSSDSSVNSSDEYSSDSKNESINLYCKEIFDITIEKIRSIVAYKLWKYIVKDINLIKIFYLFKDIYLLNNGDFYDYFLEKSWSLMHTPPNSKNEILLKVLAWKSSSMLAENYCKYMYENKEDKLILEKYENMLFTECNTNENESIFFNSTNGYYFDTDNSENIISRYFYPRISYKKFSYDSFEREKYENLILGGMCYIYDKKIVLNDFYKGIQTLYKKRYYDYDNIFSVCINNYRQQILRGFKHGFDFAVNFNNFFDNKYIDVNNKSSTSVEAMGTHNNTKQECNNENFLVGCCFALVIHSVKNPLLYKADVLNSSLGYWGSLGDCLSVEIKVKFYEKKNSKKDSTTISKHEIDHTIQHASSFNNVILGDVEIEVSLFIGGKGISSFVHNSGSYTVDYAKESILNNKIWADNINHEKKRLYEDMENNENYLRKRNTNNVNVTDQDNLKSENMEGNNNEVTKQPVLKIQSNKQIFHDINKNTLTKFRVRINCLKHSFSVYIQKLDEYNIQLNNPKNKIKPIIHIRALDMTQAFSLDIGNGYIGFYTSPILFKHKLLKKKNKLNEWFKRFYNDTLNADSTIYKKNFFFNMGDEKNKEVIQNEIRNINKIISYKNWKNQMKGEVDTWMSRNNKEKMKNMLIFSSYDCSVEIYKWFHQSYKSPIEIPEIDIDNETLIFYDKQINKNIQIHSGLNLWNNIEIYFKLTWPIALIINTSTIYTYNSIFQFLFLLGRIYYNLKILCYHNRHLYKYLNFKKGGLLFSYLFSIRYKMQFFFFHLIKYLQEDIINHEYKLMITQIHKSKDFEYTKSIHDLYISQVATKCFLRVQDITNPLLELIDTSFKFCYFFQCLIENELFTDILNYEMISEDEEKKKEKKKVDMKEVENDINNDNSDKNDNDLNQVIEKLLQYNDNFNEKLVSVINEMMNISSSSNHAYLIHLLTILDFNGYINKIKDSRINNKSIDACITDSTRTDGRFQNEQEERKINPEQDGVMIESGNLNFTKAFNDNMEDEKRDSNKRDDNKMEYSDIENINMSDNYYLDKKEIYTNRLLSGANISLSGISQNISTMNEIHGMSNVNEVVNKKDFIKKRIVNKFSNLLCNNVDEKWNIQMSKLNGYNQNGIPESTDKSLISGGIIPTAGVNNLRKYINDKCYYSSCNNVNYRNEGGSNGYNYNSEHSYNYNNYNVLIDKYSNILNSYTHNSSRGNSVNPAPQNYVNNSNLESYKTPLDVAKLRHISGIPNMADNMNIANVGNIGTGPNAPSINVYNIDTGMYQNNNVINYENSLINNTVGRMDLNSRINLNQNILNVNYGKNNNTTTDLNSHHDLNIKKNFNVQQLLDNYNYSYDGFSENNSFTSHNVNKLSNENKNTSQGYNISDASNYGNIPLNIYRKENNSIHETNREK
ncbi:gamma-tubulin complex component [Plasmodium gonderi]|uniref:Gamma-tubulin complex component n=1 Tax=Plasmodium gonderi TaxID=77519 RepID=A0A1Y1JK50_PLAGO|nr:gamma-tubulin complex component [Plasmodium gonderi]GAW82650.1 gamma-tubulin complex component [Plasmodium gonderi]